MKRTLIIFSFLLLSLFIASGQTRPRFEIESKYSLVHSNFGLMWLARAGGAVHVSQNWALNVEYGEGASAINTYIICIRFPEASVTISFREVHPNLIWFQRSVEVCCGIAKQMEQT